MITMQSCESCPFFSPASGAPVVDNKRGLCCRKPKALDLKVELVRKGCSQHPDNMQQYEELRAFARVKGEARAAQDTRPFTHKASSSRK